MSQSPQVQIPGGLPVGMLKLRIFSVHYYFKGFFFFFFFFLWASFF